MTLAHLNQTFFFFLPQSYRRRPKDFFPGQPNSQQNQQIFFFFFSRGQSQRPPTFYNPHHHLKYLSRAPRNDDPGRRERRKTATGQRGPRGSPVNWSLSTADPRQPQVSGRREYKTGSCYVEGGGGKVHGGEELTRRWGEAAGVREPPARK